MTASRVPSSTGVTSRRRQADLTMVGVATAAVAGALVVAGLRARWEGWYPMGDNAFFGIRALDVATEHHPLLGTGSSASTTAGTTVNNPGPLWFDWLAPATKLAPVGGLVVATVSAHLVALGLMVWAGLRAGGIRVALAAAAMAGALAWTMGSGLLVEPWQPHAMLFPALAYLVLVWAVVAGRTGLLPLTAAVASLLVQTHLTYVVLVPGLALLAVASIWWRARRGVGEPWRRPAMWTAAVVAVAWVQPMVDQIWRTGNLGTLLRSSGTGEGDPVGLGDGTRYVASVVARPTSWLRQGFADAFSPVPLDDTGALHGVPSMAGALLGLSAMVVLGLLALRAAHRRHDGAAVAGLVVAVAAAGLAVVTAAIIPVGPLGLGPHQLRYLWPVSLLVTATVLLGLFGGTRRWTWAAAAATVALAAAAVPAHHGGVGLDAVRSGMPVARSLGEQLDGLDRRERYRVDAEGARLYEAFTTPVMFELERRGIPFTVDHEFTLAQLGERRRDAGDATVELYVVEGPAARQAPSGERQVALVEGLSASEQRELTEVAAALRVALRDDGLVLTAAGRRARQLGAIPATDQALADETPESLVGGAELGRIVRAGYVERAGDLGRLLDRWSDLDERDRRDTVAVMARPLPASP